MAAWPNTSPPKGLCQCCIELQGSNDRCVKFCWLSICALAMGFAAEPRSVCYVWMLYRWKGDFGFLCLCRLTAKGSWKKVTLDWSIKIWCAWESRLCFANICIDFYPKMNGSGKSLFVSDCLRSQTFANTANKTDKRVKQLQHVSDSQDLGRFCQVFVNASRPFQLKVES